MRQKQNTLAYSCCHSADSPFCRQLHHFRKRTTSEHLIVLSREIANWNLRVAPCFLFTSGMAILFSVTRCGTLATLWALCEYDFKWIMYKSERNVFVQAKKSHLIFGCSIKMTFNWFLGKKVDRSIIFTPLGLLLGYFCEILGVFVQATRTLWFYSSHSLMSYSWKTKFKFDFLHLFICEWCRWHNCAT